MSTESGDPVKYIPFEVLFGNPEKIMPRISPDGTKIAYLAPRDGVLNVWVGPLGEVGNNELPEEALSVTDDTHRGIRSYFWQQDSAHVLYVQDKGGDENWRLHQTDIRDRTTRELTPFENVQVQIIAVDKHVPDKILIAMNKDDPALHDVWEVTLSTGTLILAEKNPGDVIRWFADGALHVRGALAGRPDGSWDLRIRNSKRGEWNTVISWDTQEAFLSHPLHFTRNGRYLYLCDAQNANAGRLARLDTKTNVREILAEDPEYDVSGIHIHPETYEVQAVSFTRARKEWKVLDPAVEKDFEFLNRFNQIAQGDFSLVSRDNANQKWIVAFERDNGPISYGLYDAERKNGIAFLFDHRSDLNKYRLAIMNPISFSARDGLTIHGYLTLPLHRSPYCLPVVLNVHGGPWGRNTWGYDPEAQWLANRGYACLQVNFRGSGGYGKRFFNAGNREWGGKMHDDLIDAVNWTVAKGIADPKRIAIYGASYGGYAALVGATFTPDVFCCAISEMGPSNLVTLLETVPSYWKNFLPTLYKRVGHPVHDRTFLESRSPLFKVDQIKNPLLIIQGENDPRVNRSEADQIVEAMRQKGIPHEYMLVADEGHGAAKPEARLAIYQRIEEFLAQHVQR